jgi:hypothetical protein
MNEYLTWQACQILLVCTISGAVVGTSVFQIEQHYNYRPYKESTYRATTVTGKGNFKCQTGCPLTSIQR